MSDAGEAPIRILIADDHPMLREGVAAVIARQPDMVVVGEAVDGNDAIAKFDRLRPDISLIDLQMPRMDGVQVMEAIRRIDSDARIIVLTTYGGDLQAVRALRAGAAAYLLKSGLRRELLETIRRVWAGERFVTATVAQQIALHATQEDLSGREVNILRLVALGRSNKMIAADVDLSEDTVKAHLKNIFAKLDVQDRTLAVMVAVRRGILVI